MFWCSDIDWEFSHLSWSTSITSIVIRSLFVRSQDAASARQLQVSKTVRIATAGKHAMGDGKAMCDRLNTKDVNGPRVVLWLTCWRRKVE